jgi:hypothetical protein
VTATPNLFIGNAGVSQGKVASGVERRSNDSGGRTVGAQLAELAFRATQVFTGPGDMRAV